MSRAGELGWTLMRVVFGLSLAFGHGMAKVFGGNMERFAEGVGKLGFPAPTVFAWAAALAEFAGGILVAAGLFTRPAAGLAGFTMLVALFRHRTQGFGDMELALLYFAAMVAILLVGPGALSLDARLGRGAGGRGRLRF